MAIPQSQSKSGQQSPPPSYSEAITAEPTSSHMEYNDAGCQCEHAPLGTYKHDIKTGHFAYDNEKCNCQHEHHTKEMGMPDFQKKEQDINEEGGKWETKREGMKRKWSTKKKSMKQKWEEIKKDMRSKWAKKTPEDETHPYAPLDENATANGDRVFGRKAKVKENKRYTRAELSGNPDTAILAGMASMALFVTVFL